MNDQWTAQTRRAGDNQSVPGAFNAAEWQALENIRQSYQPGHEFFTAAELSHLRFMCWLHQTGRTAG